MLEPRGGLHRENLFALIQFHAFSSSYNLGESRIQTEGGEPLHLVQSHFGSLRKPAADYLAPFMIPTEFVAIHRFPISRSGKTDQKALKEWLLKSLTVMSKQFA